MRFVFVTTQDNYTTALRDAAAAITREHGIDVSVGVYMTSELSDPAMRGRLEEDLARADFIFGGMIFGEAIVRPLVEQLAKVSCPVCIIISNPALIRLTHLGKFNLGMISDGKDKDKEKEKEKEKGGISSILQSLKPKHGHGEVSRQMNLVKGLTKILKFLPGRFRDLHTYVSAHQFWVHNTPKNMERMLCMLIERYVPGYKGKLPVEDPEIFPDVAIWHPDAPKPFTDMKSYQKWQKGRRLKLDKGVAGLLSLRVIVLGDNVRHLAGLIHALEKRGVEARLVYTAGLDGRPAIEAFFTQPAGGRAEPTIDLIATTSGFALVGGMAQSKPDEARAAMEALNLPFLQTIPLVFQSVDSWLADDRGLNPMHIAMNVALAELEGAAEPLVYGGPSSDSGVAVPVQAQVDRFAERVARRIALGRKANAEKKVALVLFNYPPNLGSIGTAAYLDVFASTYELLSQMRAAGYQIDLPASADELRQMLVEGKGDPSSAPLVHGTDAAVGAFLSLDDYRKLFPDYVDIEPFWGAAPGELLSDGRRFQILGRRLGNVFVGVQPTFGYERDPMRMLMAKDAAPHHGFAAFYTWIDKVFGADAVVHMGTHGALEFMPGKQAGLGPQCWPPRLLGGLPNIYYYCVNNPSEGTIARRRGAATLVSYLVPPVQQAGLYKGLRVLKDSIDMYRAKPSPELLEDIQVQAERLQIADCRLQTEQSEIYNLQSAMDSYIAALSHELLQVEQRLIPIGLHVLGRAPSTEELVDTLALVAAFQRPDPGAPTLPERVAAGLGFSYAELGAGLSRDPVAQDRYRQVDTICKEAIRRFIADCRLQIADLQTDQSAIYNLQSAIASTNLYLYETAQVPPDSLAATWRLLGDLRGKLTVDHETSGLLNALSGGYTPPSPGNDVVRNPAVVPTGRNIHGLDPYRIPSAAAQVSGARVVDDLLARLTKEQGQIPETVALILWGTDNIKTEGEGVAQALSLLGARAISDELGKVADVALIPLEELGRPRVDVVATVSGIFRDLMAMQAQLIDKAVRMAAAADEPEAMNFVRKHTLAQAAELGVSIDEAACRVFSNAPGTYGANVNNMVESGSWEDDSQIGDVFMTRKGFAMDKRGEWQAARPILEQALGTVQATFQNVDSVEVGISDVDHYYEYLGGVTKSVEKLRGTRPTVMMAEVEAFSGPGGGRVRSLEQMVRLDSRAKLLNPKWFEGMLAHGYEGAHEIEVRVSNTYGWSATSGAVEGWVYQGVAETYLLDEAMRERLAALNPHAAAGVARRLLEANSRGFWDADEATLEQLREIYADLEDKLEGVTS
ncbi:magnesium chelatase subunit H [Oscillochloris sp. ZM17-4]|uniref:magnesium chelatase subunit H n=1 Tax=Oscillochloris sp. ZM17-4 TaxID=2866714 RepID=UPI001C739BA8|nr:magnesium chelatase subunit H [Oscillochloris sp. ZM17-4]MBX0327455.1 magnesium chelatase subunit H [Oscillochloris sp. ZM17-4]